MTPRVEGGSVRAPEEIPNPEMAPTIYSTMKSQTTVSTIKVELCKAVNIGKDEEQLSQTSYATSANHTMRIRVPSPPSEDSAFGGKPFECPYCFNIIKIRSRQDWKYVVNYAYNFYDMLNIILGGMCSEIFNPMFAHLPTALKQVNYLTADESGLIMRPSSTGESGIVIPARNIFHGRHYFESILKQDILS